MRNQGDTVIVWNKKERNKNDKWNNISSVMETQQGNMSNFWIIVWCLWLTHVCLSWQKKEKVFNLNKPFESYSLHKEEEMERKNGEAGKVGRDYCDIWQQKRKNGRKNDDG